MRGWLLCSSALLFVNCSDDADTPTAGAIGGGGNQMNAGQAGVVVGGSSALPAGAPGAGGSAGLTSGGSPANAGGGVAAGIAGVAGGSGASGQNAGGAGAGFVLSSAELAEGASFADALTCAGQGRSPALAWTAGPPGTKSYAITFFDETLVGQGNANGYHWVIWDISAATSALPQGLPAGATLSTPVVAKQLSPANPFDQLPANAYFGPCPNALGNTNNTDSYAFTIYALGVEQLSGTLTSVKNVQSAIDAASPLAMSALRGSSSAKPD